MIVAKEVLSLGEAVTYNGLRCIVAARTTDDDCVLIKATTRPHDSCWSSGRSFIDDEDLSAWEDRNGIYDRLSFEQQSWYRWVNLFELNTDRVTLMETE